MDGIFRKSVERFSWNLDWIFRKSINGFSWNLDWIFRKYVERIFVKFGLQISKICRTDFHEIWTEYLKNMSRNFNFNYNLTRITGTLYEHVLIFITISSWMFLRKIEMLQRRVIGKIKIGILCSINFLTENRAVCKIMYKNTVQPDSP